MGVKFKAQIHILLPTHCWTLLCSHQGTDVEGPWALPQSTCSVTSLHSFRSQVILTLSHANKRGSMKTRVPARQLVTGLGTSGWVCHPRGAPKGISLGSKAQVPESDFLPASTSVSNPGYIHGPQLPFPFSR